MNDTIVNSTFHGVIAIVNERNDQINKHKHSVADDVLHNPNGELIIAARALMKENPVLHEHHPLTPDQAFKINNESNRNI